MITLRAPDRSSEIEAPPGGANQLRAADPLPESEYLGGRPQVTT